MLKLLIKLILLLVSRCQVSDFVDKSTGEEIEREVGTLLLSGDTFASVDDFYLYSLFNNKIPTGQHLCVWLESEILENKLKSGEFCYHLLVVLSKLSCDIRVPKNLTSTLEMSLLKSRTPKDVFYAAASLSILKTSKLLPEGGGTFWGAALHRVTERLDHTTGLFNSFITSEPSLSTSAYLYAAVFILTSHVSTFRIEPVATSFKKLLSLTPDSTSLKSFETGENYSLFVLAGSAATVSKQLNFEVTSLPLFVKIIDMLVIHARSDSLRYAAQALLALKGVAYSVDFVSVRVRLSNSKQAKVVDVCGLLGDILSDVTVYHSGKKLQRDKQCVYPLPDDVPKSVEIQVKGSVSSSDVSVRVTRQLSPPVPLLHLELSSSLKNDYTHNIIYKTGDNPLQRYTLKDDRDLIFNLKVTDELSGQYIQPEQATLVLNIIDTVDAIPLGVSSLFVRQLTPRVTGVSSLRISLYSAKIPPISGTYSLTLKVADKRFPSVVTLDLGTVFLRFSKKLKTQIVPSVTGNTLRVLKSVAHDYPSPLETHTRMEQPKVPHLLVTLLFSCVCVCVPVGMLVKVLSVLQVNSNMFKKLTSALPFSILVGCLSLLVVLFWVGINLVTTVSLAVPLLALTALVGNRTLCSAKAMRFGKAQMIKKME
eukprot:GHVR01171675.1.p1 GENE.GHVR01171675.1~~GHVR01171675.1.p1  ORF type:complete len:650 (+),score=114.88 GHVR01171675.1:610-2559(+)